MIQANELRIGNYLQYFDGANFIVSHHDIKIITEWTSVVAPLPKPIEITEEWLLKFGFKKIEKGYSIGISDYGYVIEYLDWREDWTFGVEYYDPVNDDELGDVYNFNGLGLKYVHQLQNIYFALTGEELVIK